MDLFHIGKVLNAKFSITVISKSLWGKNTKKVRLFVIGKAKTSWWLLVSNTSLYIPVNYIYNSNGSNGRLLDSFIFKKVFFFFNLVITIHSVATEANPFA